MKQVYKRVYIHKRELQEENTRIEHREETKQTRETRTNCKRYQKFRRMHSTQPNGSQTEIVQNKEKQQKSETTRLITIIYVKEMKLMMKI